MELATKPWQSSKTIGPITTTGVCTNCTSCTLNGVSMDYKKQDNDVDIPSVCHSVTLGCWTSLTGLCCWTDSWTAVSYSSTNPAAAVAPQQYALARTTQACCGHHHHRAQGRKQTVARRQEGAQTSHSGQQHGSVSGLHHTRISAQCPDALVQTNAQQILAFDSWECNCMRNGSSIKCIPGTARLDTPSSAAGCS